MANFNLNACFNEYVFARIIEDYNNIAIVKGRTPITATKGRELHGKVMERLANLTIDGETVSRDLTTVGKTAYLNAINEAIVPYIGSKVGTKESLSKRFSGYLDEFKEITNWNPATVKDAFANGTAEYTGYIPISPFDIRYATRNTVLSHGTEILYANQDEILKSIEIPGEDESTHATVFAEKPSGESKFDFYQRIESATDVRYRSAGGAYTKEDASGLARLKPYISDTDYKSVASWMMSIDETERMSPSALDRSANILKMLYDEGIPYTVKKDKNKGQIKATIGNSKIDVRLTETRPNEQYVGRVYKDGHAIYLVSSKQAYTHSRSYIPAVQETLGTIQYALGQEVKRRNIYSKYIKQNVGDEAVYTTKKGMEKQSMSYVSEDSHGKPILYTLYGYSDVQPDTNKSHKVYIKSQNDHSVSHEIFNNNDEAEIYLKESIQSARESFMNIVDVDYLIKEASEHIDDSDYEPIFSSDVAIAPIQRTYWDVLKGDSELYRPQSKENGNLFNEMLDTLGMIDEVDDDADIVDTTKMIDGSEIYSGTPEENIRAHLNESIDMLFGEYEEDPVDHKRFNPAMVSIFMDSPNGSSRNKANLIAAMSKLEFTGDELRGDDFQTQLIKDRLIRFDKDSAVKMSDLKSPFMKAMYDIIRMTIRQTACRVNNDDILIDKNGIVHYLAYQSTRIDNTITERLVEGTLGQIFEPDEQGVVETRYNGTPNKIFSPGYNAYILPETPETAGQSMAERTRLRGLEQTLISNIGDTLRYDLIDDGEIILNDKGDTIGRTVGSSTNVNRTYKGLYSTGYKVLIEPEPGESIKDTYIRQCEMTHLPKELVDARFATASRAYRYGNDIIDGSTVAAEYWRKNRMADESIHELMNDNQIDVYRLTGNTNVAITCKQSKKTEGKHVTGSYSDIVATGSGRNQGGIRYMTEGTVVDKNGKMTASPDVDDSTPLMKVDIMKYLRHMPADRQQMAFSVLSTASGVAEKTGVAQTTLQGFTYEDGAVVSKDFAEKYQVISDGELRPLMIGDKICDTAGNKSVIAKVIDRNMDLEEAEKAGVKESVELFNLNPDLDVVQAPYSAVGRFNAASAKWGMENPIDMKLPDGTVKEGCIGFAPMIITKHTANDHVKLYDNEQDATSSVTSGRKISAQLTWMLDAKGSRNIEHEVFSGNNSAIIDLREVLNTLGMDMSEDGRLREEYEPHINEERYIFKLPDDETLEETSDKDLADLFKLSVDSRGGFIELPFEVELLNGTKTQVLDPALSSRPDRTMYQLPVMSANLRSGQTLEDGTRTIHDYTNEYIKIFTNAVKYLKNEKQFEKAQAEGDKSNEKSAVGNMFGAQRNVETYYASIADSIRSRYFDTKHNIVRDNLMAKRVPHSATAVWSADTALGLNEISMNSMMMKNLGVKPDKDDHVMVWRDPMLRDYGVRYLKVKLDENLCGVAINPLMAVAFDGDFDGDSVGLWKPSKKTSQKEAMEQYSIEQTMLDVTHVRENGDYAFIFNTSQDVVTSELADEKKRDEAVANGEDYGPTLKERRLELEHKANEIYKSDMSPAEKLVENRKILDAMSDWARDTLCHTCCTATVSFKNEKELVSSLVDIVDSGAKGSHKKVDVYNSYLGVNTEHDENGHILPETTKAVEKYELSMQDIENTESATAIKSHGTGNAGAMSQLAAKALRCSGNLSAALYLSYLSTQGILQAKHDPVQAQTLYRMINGPIKSAWHGRSLEPTEVVVDGVATPSWKEVRELNSKGESVPVQATKDEWISRFMELHESSSGLGLEGDINIEHVKQVADALCDPETGRMYDLSNAETIKKLSSNLDRLAYSSNNGFSIICEMAKENADLFEKMRDLEPSILSENREAMKQGDLDAVRAIQPRVSKPDYVVADVRRSVIETKTIDTVQVEGNKLENAAYSKDLIDDGITVLHDGIDELKAEEESIETEVTESTTAETAVSDIEDNMDIEDETEDSVENDDHALIKIDTDETSKKPSGQDGGDGDTYGGSSSPANISNVDYTKSVDDTGVSKTKTRSLPNVKSGDKPSPGDSTYGE